MSVVSMQKMLIAGAREEQDAVLKELQRRRVFHLSKLSEENLSAPEVKERLAKAEKQAQLADHALKLLSEYAPGSEGMLASLKGGKELNFGEWEARAEKLSQAAALAESLLEKQKAIGKPLPAPPVHRFFWKGWFPGKG